MVENSREGTDASNVEYGGTDSEDYGSHKADFMEVVRLEIVPGGPPDPFLFWARQVLVQFRLIACKATLPSPLYFPLSADMLVVVLTFRLLTPRHGSTGFR